MNYMKLLRICLVSSLILELAKLMQEQYRAAQAHHFNWKSLICIIRTLIKQNIVEIKWSRLLSSSTRTCWKPYPTHSYNRESSLLHFDSGWKPMPYNFVKGKKNMIELIVIRKQKLILITGEFCRIFSNRKSY